MKSRFPGQEKSASFVKRLLFPLAFIPLVSTIVFAADPPAIPPHLLPPAVWPNVPTPPHIVPKPLPDPGGPMTLERLSRVTVSGVVYNEILRSLTGKGATATTGTSQANAFGLQPGTDSLRVETLADVADTANATADTAQDVEPSVVAVNFDATHYTSTTFIKYVTVPGLTGLWPRNHYSTTSNFVTFPDRGELPIPTGYALSGDPLMSVNPYTGGLGRTRIYCTGIIFNAGLQNALNAIAVWWSDDGGRMWSQPALVATQAGGGYFVDKPAIAVSWHSGTLGYVYVTWANVDFNNAGASSIWVARSTDGGITFPNRTVISYDDVQFPQVVVNPFSGAVFSLWVNIRLNDIRSSQSTDFGLNFGPHEVASVGGNLLTRLTGAALNGIVVANSVPMARYNWVTNRVALVYHGRNGANGTDIYYVHRPCTTRCNFWGWEEPQIVNDEGTNDQFMPGIDYNGSGQLVIPFYDRREDGTQNRLYHQYFAFINSSGTQVHGNRRISTFASDPNHHTVLDARANFIGDYQDTWDHTYPEGERAVSAWIGILNDPTNGDDYLTRIFY